MARIARLQLLAEHEIEAIKDASLAILRDTGVMVHHDEILRLLGEAGATVDAGHKIARLPEKLVMDCRRTGGQAIRAVRPGPELGSLASAMAISCSCPARDNTPGSTCRPASVAPRPFRTRTMPSAWAMPWRISRSSARWPSPKRSRRSTGTWPSRPSLSKAPASPPAAGSATAPRPATFSKSTAPSPAATPPCGLARWSRPSWSRSARCNCRGTASTSSASSPRPASR